MTETTASTRDRILSRIEGQTLCDLFQTTVSSYGSKPALSWEEGGEWHTLSWSDYGDRVKRVAMALAHRGVGKGDHVAMMMKNRPEHVIADIGALHAGATPVSVYNTLAPDQIAYVAGNCDAKVAILDDVEVYERWKSVRDQLPQLDLIVLIEGTVDDDDSVLSWGDLLEEGGRHLVDASESAFEERWKSVQAEDAATLIYTSGTTGPPKGVVETHKGLLFIMESVREGVELPMHQVTLSYLPLAHVAERMFSHYGSLKYASHQYFCDEINKMAEVLPVARPTAFLAVPRVWEKMRASLLAALEQAEGAKARIGKQAIAVAPQLGAFKLSGKSPSIVLRLQTGLFERLVYSKVRERLGLDRCEIAITGAAPMSDDLILFFAGLGIEILNVYGMTETTAVTNANRPGEVRLGTVGPALPGVEVKIAGDGEILTRGPSMTPRYHARDEATEELFDDEGWLHTGDLGEIDEDGYLKIVGRKKELIVTSSGKNIAPTHIEALVKEHPLIGQVMVLGDDRNYLTALIVIDVDQAPTWAERNGVPFNSLAEFSQRDEVQQAVQEAVDSANERLARIEQIKKFEILPVDWTAESGELTPSLKLRRHIVSEKYSDVIDTLYSAAE